MDITQMAMEAAEAVGRKNSEIIDKIRNMYPDVDWPDFAQTNTKYFISRYRTEDAEKFCEMFGIKPLTKDIVRRLKAYMENLPNMRTAEGFKLNMDPKSQVVYASASELYTPVHHEELMEVVSNVLALPEMQAFGKPQIKIRMLGNGAKCLIKCKFPDIAYDINQGKKDKKPDLVNPEISFKNSYDLGWKLSALFGAFRLVCTNDLVIGKLFSRYVKRHMPNLQIDSIKETLLEGMNAFQQEVSVWNKWSDRKILKVEYDNIFEALGFTAKRVSEIESIPEEFTRRLLPESVADGSLTMWQFYNTITQFFTHNVESEMVRVETGQKVADLFHAPRKWAAKEK